MDDADSPDPWTLPVPRGCLQEVAALFKEYGFQMATRDLRFAGTPFSWSFRATLRVHQAEAVDAIMQHDEGGGSKMKRTGLIDVAIVQSLYQDHAVKDFVVEYGHVVVDECHHLSAVTFEKVLAATKAKYILGLTATGSQHR